jgi:hypothetical protein
MAPTGNTTKAGNRSQATNGSRLERNQTLRLAQVAAQLIAEGLNDYQAAKRKAARQLGFPTHIAMPDDAAVEAAVRQHQGLFGDPAQLTALRQLREVALEVMDRLAQFSPWLLGPVLTHTATIHSDIELEIVDVEPKIFEMSMLDKRVAFDLLPTSAAHRDSIARYDISYGRYNLRCTVYRSEAVRRSADSKMNRKKERVQLAQAKARFAIDAA